MAASAHRHCPGPQVGRPHAATCFPSGSTKTACRLQSLWPLARVSRVAAGTSPVAQNSQGLVWVPRGWPCFPGHSGPQSVEAPDPGQVPETICHVC